jgi:hypothetical protein
VTRRSPTTLALFTAALLATACGGGDSSTPTELPATESTPTSDEPAATTAPDTAVPATDPAATEPPATDEPDDATAEPGDSAAPTSFDTASLAARIADTVAGLTFEDSSAELADCPSAAMFTMISQMASGPLLQQAEITLTPDDVASTAGAYDLPISGTALLGCNASSEENGIGVDIGLAPSGIEAYLREFNDPDDVDDLVYDITPSGDAAGGALFQIRIDTIDEETAFPYNGREVLWVDDNVMVSAYAYGPTLRDVDLDQIQNTVVEFLPELVDTSFT